MAYVRRCSCNEAAHGLDVLPLVATATKQGLTAMSYQTVNPYTGELVASYAFATDQEIDATTEKAHVAFLGWRTIVFGDR
jgi:acyl-CoA reductase-like NAD-dependent aldehyde dehydrogenase